MKEKKLRKRTPYKVQFADYLRAANIRNDKEYDYIVGIDEQLQFLEVAVGTHANDIKKKLFNQNIQHNVFRGWVDRAKDIIDERDRETVFYKATKKALFKWLDVIAYENGYVNRDKLVYDIISTINLDDKKVSTLVLIGGSNCGKSFFNERLQGVYADHEVGVLKSVEGQNVSNFWMQDLVGKDAYCSEELMINSVQILQRFKGLMEGNRTLD